MKIKLFILFILLTICSKAVSSQVTIRELVKKNDTVSAKPPTYDSLKDWHGQYYEKNRDYKQYIGLEIYIPPMSKAEESKDWGQITLFSNKPETIGGVLTSIYKPYIVDKLPDVKEFCSNPEEIRNKYYTILNVIDNSKDFWKSGVITNEIKGKFDNVNDPFLYGLMLRDNDTKDTLYYFFSGDGNFQTLGVLVPFFAKQKELYDGKRLVFTYSSYVDYTDVLTGKRVMVQPDSKWTCEVSLLKDYDYKLCYVLRNQLNETIVIRLDGNETLKKKEFILEEIYKKEQKESAANDKKYEKERIDKDRKITADHRIECIQRYGQYNGVLIAQGKVRIGMSSEMCKTAWGNPFDSHKTIVENAIFEDWHYGWGKSLHFENGILNMIEE